MQIQLRRIGIRSIQTIRFWIWTMLICVVLYLVFPKAISENGTRSDSEMLRVRGGYDKEISNRAEAEVHNVYPIDNTHDTIATLPTTTPTSDNIRGTPGIDRLTDVYDEARHHRAMEIMAMHPNVGIYARRLFGIMDFFKNNSRKYMKLMAIFDDIVLNIWAFYKGNGTVSDRQWSSLDEDSGSRRTHPINCSNIDKVRIEKKLGAGLIRVAYQGYFLDTKVVVKLKHTQFPLDACANDEFECALYRDIRFLNELILFDHLEHPSLIRVLGYCFHGGINTTDFLREPGVVGVYEIADRLKTSGVSAWNWTERIKHSQQIVKLLDFMDNSPFGHLTIHDIGWNQFVMIRDTVCLTDMDLVDNMPDPRCSDVKKHYVESQSGQSIAMCHFNHSYYSGYDFDIPCVNGTCYEMVPRHNMMKIHWVFLQHFLAVDKFPEHIQAEVKSLTTDAYNYIPVSELYARLALLLDHGTLEPL